MLNVDIKNAEKGALYTLEIKNTQVDETKNFGSYAATLSGVGLEPPLTVKLRKFNRSLGAVKLTSRVLGRIFRKHMDKLVTTPAPAPKTRAKTRVTKETKGAKEIKEAKETSPVATAPVPVPVTVPTPAPVPAPAPVPVAPEPATPIAVAFQV
jgi:hypothetical protein